MLVKYLVNACPKVSYASKNAITISFGYPIIPQKFNNKGISVISPF
jgi:hypothetical protein